MRHIRRLTSLPAYAFGEARPNLLLKTLEPLLQGLLVVVGKQNAGKASGS